MTVKRALSVPRSSGLPLRKAAVLYARAGWSIVPLAPQSDDPASLLGEKWQERSSFDPKAIKEWFREWPDAGFGLDLARSGAVALYVEAGTSAPSIDLLGAVVDGFTARHQGEKGSTWSVLGLGGQTSLPSGGYGPLKGRGEVICQERILVPATDAPEGRDGRPIWSDSGVMPTISAELYAQLSEGAPAPRDRRVAEASSKKALPRARTREAPKTEAQAGTIPDGDSTRSSWSPVQLEAVLATPISQLTPTQMLRTDGIGLLYAGQVHTFFGEPESGKSLLLQWACVEAIKAGVDVLYVDFESDARSVLRRLVALGAKRKWLGKHLMYVRPDADVRAPIDASAWSGLLSQSFGLAVIDGVTEALDLFGYQSTDNDNVARWMREVPRRLADQTGAAVALIDHVTKSSEGRGRFPIGAQAKLSAITGAAYAVSVSSPLLSGGEAEFVLRVVKDRPGGVRQHAVAGSGQLPVIARAQVTSRVMRESGDALLVTLHPPGNPESGAETRLDYDRRILDAVTAHGGLSQTQLLDKVGGNRPAATATLRELVKQNALRIEAGSRSSKLYFLEKD
ncbi:MULTISPECIES: bifunctional DNA primase/polymerase [unclassified Knoellia]|uniref:bifunctional DNA primase/polymerase n=1 Tax=Knoellia altitudinis TaxID=3404795 RepID=UPI0036225A8F